MPGTTLKGNRMDYSKKGLTGTLKPNGQVAAQLMTGIGQTVSAALMNGAARQARVAAPVPRVRPGKADDCCADPRMVTPAEHTQE